ncbi:hypothetical protein Dxin01_01777 [Deinococcus xinjiangensis]|uniref:Cell division protein FtsL n=1 Tax=Deinococcus xinjiangensis TaxID=457454 RepID=A0ABP9VD96_9DEIO
MTLFPLDFDTSPATWQRRTLRYLAIYLVLSLSLVALRYCSQHVRPALRDAQETEAKLLTQRDELEIRVQVATTPQKVQDWAEAHGMQRFAEAHKTVRDLGNQAPPPAPTPVSSAVEVKTQWK